MPSKQNKAVSSSPRRSRSIRSSTEQSSPRSRENSNSPRESHNSLASRYVPTPSRYLASRRAESPTASHNTLASHYVATPPNYLSSRRASNNATTRSSLASPYTATTPPNTSASLHTSGPPLHNTMPTSHLGAMSPLVSASPYVDSPFPNGLAFRYVATPPRSQPGHSSSHNMPATLQEDDSSRPHNGFNTTVDLTESPLGSPALNVTGFNTTAHLLVSPFSGPVMNATGFNTTADLLDSTLASPVVDATGFNSTAATVDLTDSPVVASFPPEENSPATTPSRIRCPVCMDSRARITSSRRNLVSTVCGHIFCSSCLPVCIRSSGRCPTCRTSLRPNDMHPLFI